MANETKTSPGREGRGHAFDDDTDEAIVLPKPIPEATEDSDEKSADPFDDLEIDVDEDELKAESENQPAGRKY